MMKDEKTRIQEDDKMVDLEAKAMNIKDLQDFDFVSELISGFEHT
jgi:hypothetical protein